MRRPLKQEEEKVADLTPMLDVATVSLVDFTRLFTQLQPFSLDGFGCRVVLFVQTEKFLKLIEC